LGAISFWKSAIDNYQLKQRLCWRLAYYFEGYRDRLARSLVETSSTLPEFLRDAIATKALIYRYRRLIKSLTIFEKWYKPPFQTGALVRRVWGDKL
jgi:hypothetical protein